VTRQCRTGYRIIVVALIAVRLGNGPSSAQEPPLSPEALREIALEAEIDRIEAQTLEHLAAPPDHQVFEAVWGRQAFSRRPPDVEQVCDQPGPPATHGLTPVHLTELDRGPAAATFDQSAQAIAGMRLP